MEIALKSNSAVPKIVDVRDWPAESETSPPLVLRTPRVALIALPRRLWGANHPSAEPQNGS
jgi:hypothetical protein